MHINQIKLIMLNEYEKQINKFFGKYLSNELSLKDLINNMNKLNRQYKFSRVDIKNYGNSSNNIKFFEYNKNINLSYPNWFKNEKGNGAILKWTNENTYFIFKCINEGLLKIILRGIDYRDIDNHKHPIPIYTNCKKFVVNKEVIIDENCLIWHNEPFIFQKDCNNQQYFFVELEFNTLFDYFPQLNYQIPTNTNNNEFKLLFEKLNTYIHSEKIFLENK